MFGSDELPQFQLEQSLINAWQKQHPNITVQAQQAPLGPAFQKLSTQLPTGGGPTIFSAFEPWIEGFSSYMAPAIPEAFNVKNMQGIYNLYLSNKTLESQSRNGKILCLPSSYPAWGLLINKKEFTAAGYKIPKDVPKTWRRVAAMQRKLTKYASNGDLVQRGFGVRYTAGGQWYAMLYISSVESQGAKVLDSSGKPTFTSPAGLKALRVFRDNAVEPTVTKDVQTSPYQDFANGLDVMSYGGLNAISFVERLNPAMKGNIYAALLPSLNGKPGGNPKYSFDYCVNKAASADQQYVAWSLISYITAHAKDFYKLTGGLVPLKALFNDPELKKAPFVSTYKEVLATAQPLPQTKYYGQLQQAIQDMVQKVVFNHETLKQAAQEATQEYLQSIGQ